MEQLKNITEFVIVSNLENRALNAGINKAQNWWKNRQDHTVPVQIVQPASSPPIIGIPGQLVVTIRRAEDLHESRLSALTAGAPMSERPYVVIECNQQRFKTKQADSNSTNRNPEWTSGNGPFGFSISNPNVDRLTVWIQQQDSLRVMKRNEPKILGMCEINVKQLIDKEQVWLPLRKDNRPVGQVLIKIDFRPQEEQPRSYNRIL